MTMPPTPPLAPPSTAGGRWRRMLPVLILVGIAAAWMLLGARRESSGTAVSSGGAAAGTGGAPASGSAPRGGGPPAVAVVGATARRGDMPVYLSGLGSVAAFNTVAVKSRVDGQIVRIAFTEGQLVREGELLAEIDPRPFEVQLTQAQGQLARDQAQLHDATATLQRYRALLADGVIARQDYDDKTAAVGQFEGAVKVDQGLIANAELQLTYSRITAPLSGRVGLRRVDVGNVVHQNDTDPLVVITQVQPIAVLFTMPEDNLPAVLARLRANVRLPVDAYDRAGTSKIADGALLTVDNQIDPTTGTTRLKATFANDDGALFPNQFVNVRLLLDVRKEAVIIPTAAVQRGPQGTFVYAVTPDRTVEVRPVALGPSDDADAAIDRGLEAGDVVVIEGVDKLRAGSPVTVTLAPAPGAVPNAAAVPPARGGVPSAALPETAPTAAPAV